MTPTGQIQHFRSSLIYMLAENYPYTALNMEMRRVYQSGEIGEVTYAAAKQVWKEIEYRRMRKEMP